MMKKLFWPFIFVLLASTAALALNPQIFNNPLGTQFGTAVRFDTLTGIVVGRNTANNAIARTMQTSISGLSFSTPDGVSGDPTLNGTVGVAGGGTGSTTAAGALVNLGAAGALLNTITISNQATTSDTTSFTSAYLLYLVSFENIVPATNAVNFGCLVQSAGSFQNTSYVNITGGSTVLVDFTGAGGNLSNTANIGYSAITWIRNPASTTIVKHWTAREMSYFTNTSTMVTGNSGAIWNGGTGAITGFQCAMSSGNISTGVVRVYGLR